jgi:hypothetical protein
MRVDDDRPDGITSADLQWAARRPIALLVRTVIALLIVGGAIASCFDGLQAAFVYAPPMQRLFGTAGLDAVTLGWAALAGLGVAPLVAAEKWFRSRARDANLAKDMRARATLLLACASLGAAPAARAQTLSDATMQPRASMVSVRGKGSTVSRCARAASSRLGWFAPCAAAAHVGSRVNPPVDGHPKIPGAAHLPVAHGVRLARWRRWDVRIVPATTVCVGRPVPCDAVVR